MELVSLTKCSQKPCKSIILVAIVFVARQLLRKKNKKSLSFGSKYLWMYNKFLNASRTNLKVSQIIYGASLFWFW
jgi:hypothetical protein